jgi:hypothetical protein
MVRVVNRIKEWQPERQEMQKIVISWKCFWMKAFVSQVIEAGE